jgi:hypothetical protein
MPIAALLALSSRKVLSVRPIPKLRVFSNGSVDGFANNKEGKKLFLPKKVS